MSRHLLFFLHSRGGNYGHIVMHFGYLAQVVYM